jgi:hypothetical protein
MIVRHYRQAQLERLEVWCTRCELPHCESCQTCYGFGLWQPIGHEEGLSWPIASHYAHKGTKPSGSGTVIPVKCPSCGGGLNNRGFAKAVPL